MKKEILTFGILVVIGLAVALGAGKLSRGSNDSEAVSAAAWETFGAYMEAARAHNLEGLRALSYKLSPACLDSAREEECFALMDSVYAIASSMNKADFVHMVFDEKQIITWTNGPGVAILYFTREKREAPKVLGLQFCLEIAEGDPCVEEELLKTDTNGNGWWDKTEELINEPPPTQ
ncbi:MAG: hypothetical protein WBL19_00620 [Minisyncoccia bacterium]